MRSWREPDCEKDEVEQLKVAYLDLDGPIPVVRLTAAITKNGRDDIVPLRPILSSCFVGASRDAKPTDRCSTSPPT